MVGGNHSSYKGNGISEKKLRKEEDKGQKPMHTAPLTMTEEEETGGVEPTSGGRGLINPNQLMEEALIQRRRSNNIMIGDLSIPFSQEERGMNLSYPHNIMIGRFSAPLEEGLPIVTSTASTDVTSPVCENRLEHPVVDTYDHVELNRFKDKAVCIETINRRRFTYEDSVMIWNQAYRHMTKPYPHLWVGPFLV